MPPFHLNKLVFKDAYSELGTGPRKQIPMICPSTPVPSSSCLSFTGDKPSPKSHSTAGLGSELRLFTPAPPNTAATPEVDKVS